jgi:ArsR family transcriptional regulator, lead/cadmium/zinc/bismuth-responsive transcriptional repressor
MDTRLGKRGAPTARSSVLMRSRGSPPHWCIGRVPLAPSAQLFIFHHSMDRRSTRHTTRGSTHGGHLPRPAAPVPSRMQIEAAAEMFQALGDPERLRLLLRLAEREACVSELAEDEGEKITTVSARLKTLAIVRLVRRRREAKHVFYALADEHVLPLVRNAIDHAAESRTEVSTDLGHGKDTSP